MSRKARPCDSHLYKTGTEMEVGDGPLELGHCDILSWTMEREVESDIF